MECEGSPLGWDRALFLPFPTELFEKEPEPSKWLTGTQTQLTALGVEELSPVDSVKECCPPACLHFTTICGVAHNFSDTPLILKETLYLQGQVMSVQ